MKRQRRTPQTIKVTIFTEMYPHQLMREVADLAKLIWIDLPERGQSYYKNHTASWRHGKEDRHIIVTADRWIHEAGQTKPVSTDIVMSILLSLRNDALRVVMRFDESLPFAHALYMELVDINRRIRYDGRVTIEGMR